MITPNDGDKEGNPASNLNDEDAGKNTSLIQIKNRTGSLTI